MKKFSLVLLALAVLVTPYAEAKTCFGISCNYIDTNSGFQNATPGQYWTYDPGTSFVTESSCYSSKVANLDAGEGVWRFPYIDATYSSFKLQFRAYLPGDTNTSSDELVITVKDNTTQIEETMYLRGNSYDTQCSYINFYLSNDYSLDNVTVTFESSGSSPHAWQIDDVGFFAYY